MGKKKAQKEVKDRNSINLMSLIRAVVDTPSVPVLARKYFETDPKDVYEYLQGNRYVPSLRRLKIISKNTGINFYAICAAASGVPYKKILNALGNQKKMEKILLG